ncbi:tape measure protein [Pseudomonas indica]|uniref:tape measure protein n=1 Tax=Pseudomonas indica TaxID=137658 RepID=UPI003FD01B02
MTDFEFRLTAHADQATKEVAGFRKEYVDMVKTVEKPLRQIDAFKETQEGAKKAAAEYFAAKRKVEQLTTAMAAAKQPVQGLDRELAKAERTLARVSLEFDRQKGKIRQERDELRAAGVDTRKLAAEQARLQVEMARGFAAGRRDAAVASLRNHRAELQKLALTQRQTNIEAARSDLGVTRARAAEAEIQRLRNQYALLRQTGGLTNRELAIAQKTLTQRIKESQDALADMAGEQRRLGSDGGVGIGGALSLVGIAAGAAASLRSYVEITDTAKKMEAQLKLATKSQQEFTKAQEDTFRIAQQTKSPVEDVTTLYARLSPALRDAGRNQEDVAKVTEALAASLKISGASAAETSSTLTQFSQALASGALRGEEFNSVAEAAPRLMRALADGLEVPVGALRQMAADGELTADVITDLVLNALPDLREEASKIPDTVESSLTALRNDVIKAFGDGDTSGFINALNVLRQTLTDPHVVQGLTDIATGMATLAGWTATVASEFSAFAKEVAFTAAEVNGYVDELAKLEKTLQEVNNARTGDSFIGSNTVAQMLKFFAPERLDEWAAELERKIEETRAKINGVTVEVQKDQEKAAEESRKIADEAARVDNARREAQLSSERSYISSLKNIRDQQVKDAEAAIKKQESAEKKALSEIDKIRKDRLAIEERYSDALTRLRGGGAGDASFGAATALKLGAQESLRKGDIESAKRQAQAALDMLLELQAAGENTYGFAGFAEQLKAIELKANDLEKSKADEKLKSIKDSISDLKASAANLESLPIKFNLSPEEIDKLKSQLQELAKTPVVIPVRLEPTPEMQAIGLQPSEQVSFPGFADGGKIAGPGTGTSDSILMWGSNGEFMQPARAVRYYGEGFMESIRQMRFPRFADGGMVGARALPAIPAFNPADLAPANPLADFGTVHLGVGGDTLEVLMRRDTFEQTLRRTATKFGRTKR